MAAGTKPSANDPPAVVIAYRPHPGCARTLREVCAGIEEEGIHFRTVSLEATDAAALAHEAASRSPLLVGVGVHESELCVHTAALPADAPVERHAVSSHERACQRHVGHNAARLAKVMPLKGYRDGEETDVLWPGEARRGQVRRRDHNGDKAAVAHDDTTNNAEVSKA